MKTKHPGYYESCIIHVEHWMPRNHIYCSPAAFEELTKRLKGMKIEKPEPLEKGRK